MRFLAGGSYMQRSPVFLLLLLLVALVAMPACALGPPGAVQNTSPGVPVQTARPVLPTASPVTAFPTIFIPGEQAAGLGPWLFIGIVVIVIAIAGFVYLYVFR
jgi:hypothetical protein